MLNCISIKFKFVPIQYKSTYLSVAYNPQSNHGHGLWIIFSKVSHLHAGEPVSILRCTISQTNIFATPDNFRNNFYWNVITERLLLPRVTPDYTQAKT